MPSALGLKHPAWDLSRLAFLSCCLQEALHVGVCARGHSGHPVPTTDSRYKLMGSVGSLVAGYLVLMPKTNFK